MKKYEKVYLMLGGTFLPAFAGVGLYSILYKQPISAKSGRIVLLFALMSAVGGYFTSYMLSENKDKFLPDEKTGIPEIR